jgi:hypothetical protein
MFRRKPRQGDGAGEDMYGTRERDAVPALPGRCWQDVVLAAQRELAGTLEGAIRQGRLTTDPYRNWLALESSLCGINAEALDRAAAWHGAQPALQAHAHAWAGAIRNAAALAAAEAASLGPRRRAPADGASPDVARSELPTGHRVATEVQQWREFMALAVPSARAGEALGVVALHARLMRGPMREAIAAIAGLPWVAGVGCRYLLQRREPDATAPNDYALLDAYAASALTVGAQRAARWYRAAMQRVLWPIEPAPAKPLPGT